MSFLSYVLELMDTKAKRGGEGGGGRWSFEWRGRECVLGVGLMSRSLFPVADMQSTKATTKCAYNNWKTFFFRAVEGGTVGVP